MNEIILKQLYCEAAVLNQYIGFGKFTIVTIDVYKKCCYRKQDKQPNHHGDHEFN